MPKSFDWCLTAPKIIAFVSLVVACDEPKNTTPTTAGPAATPSAEPAPPPAAPAQPAAEPVVAKPKKKLEDCPKGPEVTLPNEVFEAQLRVKLQKPTGTITTADLKKLRSLNLSQVKLDELDICVFSPMTSLKELFLGQGQYDDLSPIQGAVQLESLRASLSQVRDLKPLEKMTKMDRLDLGQTQVSDLTPLEAMTNLTELQLDNTSVEDLAPLAKLTKLELLSVKNTRVKDASPLKDLKKLKIVYIGGSPLAAEPVGLGPLRASGTKINTD